MTSASPPSAPRRFGLRTLGFLVLPLLLLAGVIALFLGQGGMRLESAAPIESLSIERYTLDTGQINISVRNTGAEDTTAFSGGNVAVFITDSGADKNVSHKELIIPGYASPLSGRIEEATGWKVLVGPRDAAEIGEFLHEEWKKSPPQN